MKKSTKKILKKLIRNEFDRIPDEIHTEKQSLQLVSVAIDLGFVELSAEMLQDLR